VRLWDYAAKLPGAATPGLGHFETILRAVSGRAA
jgi:hypothetical protein